MSESVAATLEAVPIYSSSLSSLSSSDSSSSSAPSKMSSSTNDDAVLPLHPLPPKSPLPSSPPPPCYIQRLDSSTLCCCLSYLTLSARFRFHEAAKYFSSPFLTCNPILWSTQVYTTSKNFLLPEKYHTHVRILRISEGERHRGLDLRAFIKVNELRLHAPSGPIVDETFKKWLVGTSLASTLGTTETSIKTNLYGLLKENRENKNNEEEHKKNRTLDQFWPISPSIDTSNPTLITTLSLKLYPEHIKLLTSPEYGIFLHPRIASLTALTYDVSGYSQPVNQIALLRNLKWLKIDSAIPATTQISTSAPANLSCGTRISAFYFLPALETLIVSKMQFSKSSKYCPEFPVSLLYLELTIEVYNDTSILPMEISAFESVLSSVLNQPEQRHRDFECRLVMSPKQVHASAWRLVDEATLLKVRQQRELDIVEMQADKGKVYLVEMRKRKDYVMNEEEVSSSSLPPISSCAMAKHNLSHFISLTSLTLTREFITTELIVALRVIPSIHLTHIDLSLYNRVVDTIMSQPTCQFWNAIGRQTGLKTLKLSFKSEAPAKITSPQIIDHGISVIEANVQLETLMIVSDRTMNFTWNTAKTLAKLSRLSSVTFESPSLVAVDSIRLLLTSNSLTHLALIDFSASDTVAVYQSAAIRSICNLLVRHQREFVTSRRRIFSTVNRISPTDIVHALLPVSMVRTVNSSVRRWDVQ